MGSGPSGWINFSPSTIFMSRSVALSLSLSLSLCGNKICWPKEDNLKRTNVDCDHPVCRISRSLILSNLWHFDLGNHLPTSKITNCQLPPTTWWKSNFDAAITDLCRDLLRGSYNFYNNYSRDRLWIVEEKKNDMFIWSNK